MFTTNAAQTPVGGWIEGLGPLGKVTAYFLNPADTVGFFNKVLSVIIGVLTVVAGLWFIFNFFLGAFSWISAGSDKGSMENARKRMTNAVIGIVAVVAAIFIIDLVGGVLGLDILSPGKFILSIWP